MTQSTRRRSDAELSDLFARGTWRLRAYVEALADWARGANSTALVADESIVRRVHRSERSGVFRPLDALREHPVLFVGGALAVLWIVAVIPLLGRGQILGGQVAAWPDGAMTFLSGYAADWGSGPVASAAFDSPVQPVLGVLSALVGGGAWVGQRLVVLGIVPLAWAVAVRAGRLITSAPGPRVVGATIYAASPLVLGAFAQGRLDVLTFAAALPPALLLAARAGQAGVPPGRAWRSTALLAVVMTIALAVAPPAWPVLALLLAAVGVLAGRNRTVRRTAAWRLAVAALAAVALLLPWQVGLRSPAVEPAGGLIGVAPSTTRPHAAALPLWEALTGLSRDVPGMDGPAAWLWVATAAAAGLTAVLFGMRQRAGTVVVLAGTMVAFAGAATLASRQTAPAVPPDMLLVPVALALGGLGVTAARSVAGALSRYELGFRHAVALVAAAAIVAGPVGVMWKAVAVGQWPQLRVEPETVPLFVQADASRLGPYRILLLDGSDALMRWDVTEPGGPTMTTFGAGASRGMRQSLDQTVAGLLAGDRRAVGMAGLLNVRYIVLRDDVTREAVAPALMDLAGVEPLAAGGGRVYEVRTWLPRAAVVPEDVLRSALAGHPVAQDAVEAMALQPLGPDRYVGGPVGEGIVVASESRDGAWDAQADGRPLETARQTFGDLPVNAFVLDAEAQGVTVTATTASRPWWIVWQAALLLLLLSLTLRAPGQAIPPVALDPSAIPEGGRSDADARRAPSGARSGSGPPWPAEGPAPSRVAPGADRDVTL